MPAYAVGLCAVLRQKPGTVWTSVDGWSEQFSLFERVGELAVREVEGDDFPPRIGEPRALELARRGLFEIILRRRGQIGKPVIEAVEGIRLYHTPVWVCYRRRRKRLDLEVLDGYTGDRAGAKTRVAVLDALIAVSKKTT